MKYGAEVGSGTMIYITSTEKLIKGYTDTERMEIA
jgi:hypothetical protein